MADTERLLLQVDAATELLRRHLAEGEQPLDRFERRAEKMAENVERSIGDMGSRFGDFSRLADDAAKRAQRSFEASFSQVQRLAATAIKGPTIDGRVNLGAEDIRAGAAAAQDQARAFALIGEAAERTALRVGDTSEATRLFVQATNASRLEAERKAAALLAEAGALERVEIELMQSAEAADLFVGKHQRIAQAAAQEQQLSIATAEAATQMRALASAADLLHADIDPMYLAQKRFNDELDRADALIRAELISQRQYEQQVAVARDRLQAHAQAVGSSSAGTRALTANQGALRAAMTSASYQVQDFFTQMSMGANIIQVAVIQGGQLTGQFANVKAEAGTMTGKVVAFSQFMQGPWGIAIQAGLLVLGPLIARQLDFGNAVDDAVDKLKEDAKQSETNAAAKRRFATSVEGLTLALHDQEEALNKTAEAERSSAERANIAAKTERDRALSIRETTAARLADALAAQQALNDSDFANTDPRAAAVARRVRDENVTALQKQVNDAQAALRQAQINLNVTRVDLAAEEAQIAVDPVRSVTKLYDDRIKALKDTQREEARLGKQVGAASAQRLRDLETEKAAAIKAAQARQSAERAAAKAGPLTTFQSPVTGGRVTGRFGESRPGHQHAGIDYAVPVGTPVRAPASGVIDVAGARQGYGNAIYINFGGGTTGRFGHLSKFNVKPGDYVDAGDVIGYSGGAAGEPGSGRSTGPHLHYEVRQGGRAVDPATGRFRTDAGAASNTAANRQDAQKRKDDAEARAQEAARQKLLREDTSYSEQERAARQKLLDATRKTTQSEVQRDDLLRESINAEADATEQKIANQFEAGQINLAEAQHLYSINEATRAQRLQNVTIEAAQRTINARYEAEEQSLDTRLTQLRLEQDLANTDGDRRRIGRQILEIEQTLRRKKLEQIRDTSNDPQAVQRATDELAALAKVERLEKDQEDRRTASPLDQYRERLRAATGDMNEALHRVEAGGIQSLEDELTGIISGTESVGSAFKKMAQSIIADLARIAIQKTILSVIGGGSLFGLAKGGALADASGSIERRATGGRISGPGSGTSDSILALIDGAKPLLVSNGEFIVNERSTREYLPLIKAINERRLPRFAGGGMLGEPQLPALRYPQLPAMSGANRQGQRLQVTGKIEVASNENFDAKMTGLAFRAVGASAEPIMAGAQSRTIARLNRPDLPGGFG